jgi:hypothetical protein
VVDVFAILLQHLDGGSDFSGCGRLHNQMWMPCECVRLDCCLRLLRS